MMIFLILKLLVIVIFLVIFLRRPNLVWGIGLLTVTTAVLLDAFLGTFGREEMAAELGFFFYVIGGALVGGAAVWMWGVLRPLLARETAVAAPAAAPPPPNPGAKKVKGGENTAFDRQMLYQEICQRLSPEDVRDLIFDLEINENDVMALQQDMDHLIISLMNEAEAQGKVGALALAVERILTPLPPENLPRPEKIDVDSPPTILRHYLLAHYDLAQLAEMTAALQIDWEQLDSASKKSRVRSLLLHLYRRNRIGELVAYMHGETAVSGPEEEE